MGTIKTYYAYLFCGIGAIACSLIADFAPLDIAKIALGAAFICAFGLFLLFSREGIIWLQTNRSRSHRKDLPEILPCFNGQRFILEKIQDKEGYYRLIGQITRAGSYAPVPEISFCVPRLTPSPLRLGYYMNAGYVLVDVSSSLLVMPQAFMASTDRVWIDFVPFPRPQ
jgi:hypothetical protein